MRLEDQYFFLRHVFEVPPLMIVTEVIASGVIANITTANLRALWHSPPNLNALNLLCIWEVRTHRIVGSRVINDSWGSQAVRQGHLICSVTSNDVIGHGIPRTSYQ